MCFRPPSAVSGPVNCPECGKEVENADTLEACPHCGAKVAAGVAPGVPGIPGAPGAPKPPGAPGAPKAPGQ